MTDVLGFDFKPDYYYSKDHIWIKIEVEGIVKAGFDDIVAKGGHEIFFVKLIDEGTEVKLKKKLGVIESRKYTGPIVSPISGKVLEVNPEVVKRGPIAFMDDPYEKGWLMTLKPSNLDADLKNLMIGDAALDWFTKAAEPLLDEIALYRQKHGKQIN